MKNSNITTGILLIILGTFWFLSKIGIITWSLWRTLSQIWPLILIVVGINIIFKEKRYVKVITWIVFVIIVIAFGFYQQYNYNSGLFLFENNDNVIQGDSESFEVPYDENTVKGDLRLRLGGVDLKIGSTSNNILDANISSSRIRKNADFNSDKSKVDINIEQIGDSIHLGSNMKNNYSFNLHEDVLWDIDADMGAVNGTLDMSNLKIEKLNLDTGASNFNLIFGDKSDSTEVKIDGGVSNIELTIPEKVGVRIKTDGFIKDSNIDELGWILKDKHYMSQNYKDVEKKINIDINMGVGKFDVNSVK